MNKLATRVALAAIAGVAFILMSISARAQKARIMQRRGLIVLALFLTAMLDSQVSASNFFATGSINVSYDYPNNFAIYGDSYNRTGFTTTGGQLNYDNAGIAVPGTSIHAQADSLGGPGFVRAHDFGQLVSNTSESALPLDFTVNSSSFINATFSDVVVSGSPGVVPARLNLHLDGSFINGTTFVTDAQTAANNFVGIGVYVNNNSVASGDYYYVSTNGSPPAEYLSHGVLTDFNGNLDFQTNVFFVQTGVPFSVLLQLQVGASAEGPANRGLIVDANSDFSNTFSFATDRPAISLPVGYTANSADAGIVDNSFVVPEPGSLLLLACGLAAVLLVRRMGLVVV